MMNISEQVKAGDVMSPVVSIDSSVTVLEAVDALVRGDSGGVLVMEDGLLKSIITDYELILWLKDGKIKSLDDKISRLIPHRTFYAYPDDSIKKVADIMFSESARFIPITSGDKILGVITRKEILEIFGKYYGRNYKARDLMTYRYTTISLNDPLKKFLANIQSYDDKYSIVLSHEQVVGVITPMDLLIHLRQKNAIDIKADIQQLMTPDPYTARPADRCDEIAKTMIRKNISGVPIIDKKIQGLIRANCFLQFLEN